MTLGRSFVDFFDSLIPMAPLRNQNTFLTPTMPLILLTRHVPRTASETSTFNLKISIQLYVFDKKTILSLKTIDSKLNAILASNHHNTDFILEWKIRGPDFLQFV